MVDINKLNDALGRTRQYLESTQQPDGTWSGLVESDPRVTAFYLNSLWYLGRDHDHRTREMEAYLAFEQLECGAWEARPGGGPDIDVTAVCVFALDKAATEQGRRARKAAQDWLSSQPVPASDLFWKGYLAFNGELSWLKMPYITTRLVSNPDWLHPNVYDLSFVRTSVISLALIQEHMARRPRPKNQKANGHSDSAAVDDQQFAEWKRRWIAGARNPIRGSHPLLSNLLRLFDRAMPIKKHRKAAIEWLLARQEPDGSFFSSVHMTSMAILALHTVDASSYKAQIDAGLEAMHKWQVVDERGRWQQFTDSTNWDTTLCMDLLGKLGVPPTDPKIRLARDYLVSSQNTHHGDWSSRVGRVAPGGWSFQRIGNWYPDVDDTALIVTVLLDLNDQSVHEAAARGIEWILGLQCSDGGWASWDRNDRSWVKFPGSGPWLARDLSCADITARVIVLFSRIISGRHTGFDALVPRITEARRRAFNWLKRNRKGGAWFGAWFTHYLYGTSQALEAYREMGLEPDEPDVRTALDWLLAVANLDGGYGETPESANQGGFAQGASTPFHTACALNGLVRAGAANHPAAQRAAEWLVKHQNADGTWTNRSFFAAGVPGLWYASFSLVPTCSAAKSLLLFKEEYRSSQPERCL